jgi:hypothetical protein
MGGDAFSRQLYFDLGTDSFTGNVDRLDWDLAFDARDGEYYVWLNSANSQGSTTLTVIAATGQTEMNSVTGTQGLDNLWHWETSTGDTALNALGPWWTWQGNTMVSKNEVIAVGRGYAHDWSEYLGNGKFIIDSFDENSYWIRADELSGTNPVSLQLTRDPRYNFSYLSFDGRPHQVAVEPRKEDWDLVFTRYVYTYDDPPDFPYPVVGVLINPSNVEVAEMSLPSGMPFDSVDIYDVTGLSFSNDWDVIGFEWKIFDNTGYVTDPSQVYIIKSYEGDYYKLRFLDYYNDLGERGFPKFEYAPL